MSYYREVSVLTGDLTASSSLGSEKIERAFAALEDCARMQESWFDTQLHFSRHRGDGWQVVLPKPEYAIRSALAFRAALRAEGMEFETYIGIATDTVDGEVSEDLNHETDRVFQRSGKELDLVKLVGPYMMSYSGKGDIGAATVLLDSISQAWTPTQATTILPFLTTKDRPVQQDVAKALGKSRQAVAKSLEAAHFEPILFALKFIEEARTHNA